MFLVIEQLKELLKSYTVAQCVANATGSKTDLDYAASLLTQINTIRLNLGIQAEMHQIFYDQVNIPAAASAATVQNKWYSRNDRNYVVKRGISNLATGTRVALLNQGNKQRVITREPVAWQQLFSVAQIALNGQQSLFDLPEALRFTENQALDIAVQGQTVAAKIFLHGASIQENLAQSSIKSLQDEFIDEDGITKYLPESQLVPLIFQFPTNVNGVYATDQQGGENIFTVRNERSVLLTRISTTGLAYRIDKLIDEARNQTICDRVEVVGVAGYYVNGYQSYYDLPYPHLLRAGDRIKAVLKNGSDFGGAIPANTNTYLTFEGITL